MWGQSHGTRAQSSRASPQVRALSVIHRPLTATRSLLDTICINRASYKLVHAPRWRPPVIQLPWVFDLACVFAVAFSTMTRSLRLLLPCSRFFLTISFPLRPVTLGRHLSVRCRRRLILIVLLNLLQPSPPLVLFLLRRIWIFVILQPEAKPVHCSAL